MAGSGDVSAILQPAETPTFGPVVLLLGTLAALPPASLQDLQPVVLLQLQDPQGDLVSVGRA